MRKPAPKKKAKAAPQMEPRPIGRPTSFRPEFVEQAAKLTKLGATDRDLAEFFGVCQATIDSWKVTQPDFLGSLKLGKDESDGSVERSLYNRARGYSFESEEIFCKDGEITRVKVIKHVPPDPTSMIFWLKNRRRDAWRDKQEVDVEGGVEITIKGGLPTTKAE
jgi:hypothetical protein